MIQGDTYITPEDTPRLLMDRLALGTRAYFVVGILNIINQARIMCNAGDYDNQAWVDSSYQVFKLIEGCGGRFHIQGLANVAASPAPAVFVSNHMSTLETFVFPCLIQPYRDLTYVVKESLVENSFFGPIMRSRNPIVVSRDNPREDFKTVMEQGQAILATGRSIVVFPQSTRTPVFEPENFNTLGIKLARAAKVEVIPVAIKTDFWGNGRWLKDFGPLKRDKPIFISFGKAMVVQGSGKNEHALVIEFIQDNLSRWI
ncbi:MAG: 1-acyl-sn-glycerol-3-phosphate acyltransferase [Syntrophomonadaceae bacterium]|nr:1-acyl-sn-glycerol-3-phosphate acyltransferase [Syntrophomonadaceae bacterium]